MFAIFYHNCLHKPIEEIVDVLEHKGVCIQEHTLGEFRQCPRMQLGERDAQLRAREDGEMLGVPAVEAVDSHQSVEGVLQLVAVGR